MGMEWKLIETAPKDGTHVYLVRLNPEWKQSSWYVSTGFWQPFDEPSHGVHGIWWLEDRNEVDEPTHWMPIPDAPAAKE